MQGLGSDSLACGPSRCRISEIAPVLRPTSSIHQGEFIAIQDIQTDTPVYLRFSAGGAWIGPQVRCPQLFVKLKAIHADIMPSLPANGSAAISASAVPSVRDPAMRPLTP